jgi:transposase
VELFAQIRRDARVEGLSVRALAGRHGVHRRTVRQALESAAPPERKPRRGVSWRLEPFKPAIDAMLVEDTTAPRKQRHTARRILARLIEEHGAQGLLSMANSFCPPAASECARWWPAKLPGDGQ